MNNFADESNYRFMDELIVDNKIIYDNNNESRNVENYRT